MTAVYAKIRKITPLLFATAFTVVLTGCNSQVSRYVPWDIPTHEGIVTKNPQQLPEIGWQTANQRKVLNRRSEAFAKAQEEERAAQRKREDQQYQAYMIARETNTAVEQQTLGAPSTRAPYQPAGRPSLQYTDTPPPATKTPKTKDSSNKITVALLLPLTGKGSKLGQAMLQAAQMALFDVGSTYFELIPRDTKSTPEGARAAAQTALNAGADLILGPVFSNGLKAVKEVTNNSTTPIVSFSTDWTQAGGNTYIMSFLPFAQIARVIDYAQQQGYSRFGAYAPQTKYSDIVLRTLKRTGAHIVQTGRYSPLQSDLSLLVEDFVATNRNVYGPEPTDVSYNFDALVLPVGGEGLKTILSLLEAYGVNTDTTKFIGTGLWDDPGLAHEAALYGSWYAAPDPSLRRDFQKRFTENYGTAPARLASLAYDATALAAVLAHSSTNGMPYSHDRMISPRGFAGIDGIFRFRPDGLPERGLAILEIRAGRARVIDPAPTAFIAAKQ